MIERPAASARDSGIGSEREGKIYSIKGGMSSHIQPAYVELLMFHISQVKGLKGVRANLMSKTMQ